MPRSLRSSSDADIWDDILTEDDEPTKVLSYQPQSSPPPSSQSEPDVEATSPISAERPMRASRPASVEQPHNVGKEQQAARTRKRKPALRHEEPLDSGSQPFAPYTASEPSRFARMQLWPGFLGFLVSAASVEGLLWVYQLIISGFNLTHVTSVPLALEHAFAQNTAPSATSWINFGVLLVLWACSFGVGGYTAARLARFAATKQGLAVFLWFVLFSALSTMISFLWRSFLPSEPFFSWTRLADASTSNNVLGLSALVLIVLVSALLGSLIGKRYGQKVFKENSLPR